MYIMQVRRRSNVFISFPIVYYFINGGIFTHRMLRSRFSFNGIPSVKLTFCVRYVPAMKKNGTVIHNATHAHYLEALIKISSSKEREREKAAHALLEYVSKVGNILKKVIWKKKKNVFHTVAWRDIFQQYFHVENILYAFVFTFHLSWFSILNRAACASIIHHHRALGENHKFSTTGSRGKSYSCLYTGRICRM